MISVASLSSLEIKIAAIERYKHNCAYMEHAVDLVVCCCIPTLIYEKKQHNHHLSQSMTPGGVL